MMDKKTDYGTIFDEKPDTSAIDTIRQLETRIAKLTELYQIEIFAQDQRIAELEAAIRDAKSLLDTGFAPDSWGMMPQEWAMHRIVKASAELGRALEVNHD